MYEADSNTLRRRVHVLAGEFGSVRGRAIVVHIHLVQLPWIQHRQEFFNERLVNAVAIESCIDFNLAWNEKDGADATAGQNRDGHKFLAETSITFNGPFLGHSLATLDVTNFSIPVAILQGQPGLVQSDTVFEPIWCYLVREKRFARGYSLGLLFGRELMDSGFLASIETKIVMNDIENRPFQT